MKKVFVSLFVGGIVLTGCGLGGEEVATLPGANPVNDSIAEEMGEQLAEEMMGGLDLEFVEEGSDDVVAWPGEMPSDVPLFKYAEIEATMANPVGSSGVVVSFKNVQEGAYVKYEQDLKGAGWTIITDEAWEDEHITAEKGNSTIDVDVDYNGENTAALYFIEYGQAAE